MKYFAKTLLVFTILSSSVMVYGQGGETYVTTGGEWIFSFGGSGDDGAVRFSPVVNFQINVNKDVSDKFGFYSGLAIRNVGFIWDDPDSAQIRKKFRTYNLGIPVGLKFGDMNGMMLFGGYELEIPFNYKEKTFVNEKKEDKFNVYFSGRVPPVYHALFAGVQFYSGISLKFKYYLTNFHDQSYTEVVNGVSVMPYKNLDSNVFYLSLNFNLFRNTDFHYKKIDRDLKQVSMR
ncbi:hypothetical protein N7E81_12760 [Reichenbachiella carrageenanivorans]|uniref:Outer membrane protein beta-barrel domain-containing protein n=1 Tax=Reichenbachiella carrageenanivorans TaxID=2979869 RepID=A0ABY6CZK6_9BACT|nr:hypothetical protein [Reichenbachiella carrageenanivorans]UXX78228.1 hypothetical protein N7E81_12760 [Reichenbachiella carrageenanivorans]